MSQTKQTNTRQMPCSKTVVSSKNYSDLLYAWIQCNSDRVSPHSVERQINKDQVKFARIERDMKDSAGEQIMTRKTISKYFKWLVDQGFLVGDGDVYKLYVFDKAEANLIHYETLSKLLHVFKQHAIDIYQYLLGRYYANQQRPFTAPISDIKKYIGVATTTTSNNAVVTDVLDILKRLQLLDFDRVQVQPDKTQLRFLWVSSCLPEAK